MKTQKLFRLVSEMLKNSKKSDRELAGILGVSQPTVSRTRARIEKEYIKTYTIIPDFQKLGYQIMAFTLAKMKTHSENEAAEQGSRCLECSVNTTFDGSKCILCNACVDICPWACLEIVSLHQIEGDERVEQVIESHLGAPLSSYKDGKDLMAAAMLKDERACTRCALCADRCPTGAITMEAFRFEEVLSFGEEKE